MGTGTGVEGRQEDNEGEGWGELQLISITSHPCGGHMHPLPLNFEGLQLQNLCEKPCAPCIR